MNLSETVLALEEGLITQDEALEQTGVSNISELYERDACQRIETATFAVNELVLTLH